MTDRPMILIAEDEPDAATLLVFHLRRQGFRTLVASDGVAALNAVFAEKPVLLLLDLLMPKLHGLQVCRMLKSSPITQHIPIIIVTALGATEDKLRGFTQGADDYVTKPFDMPELLARINTVLPQSALGYRGGWTPKDDSLMPRPPSRRHKSS
jgi:DNA-binding response OmpR family regulator